MNNNTNILSAKFRSQLHGLLIQSGLDASEATKFINNQHFLVLKEKTIERLQSIINFIENNKFVDAEFLIQRIYDDNESKWISVKERLPEEGSYLVYLNNGQMAVSFYRTDEEYIQGWSVELNNLGSHLYVTHWQPKPEAPKED